MYSHLHKLSGSCEGSVRVKFALLKSWPEKNNDNDKDNDNGIDDDNDDNTNTNNDNYSSTDKNNDNTTATTTTTNKTNNNSENNYDNTIFIIILFNRLWKINLWLIWISHNVRGMCLLISPIFIQQDIC